MADLKSIQIKILTYGIYALIFVLTSLTAWQHLQLTELPDNYVRLERYKEDQKIDRGSLERIEDKLDQLIMSRNKK